MRGSDGGDGGAASFVLCERIRKRKKMKIKTEGKERRTNTSIFNYRFF